MDTINLCASFLERTRCQIIENLQYDWFPRVYINPDSRFDHYLTLCSGDNLPPDIQLRYDFWLWGLCKWAEQMAKEKEQIK